MSLEIDYPINSIPLSIDNIKMTMTKMKWEVLYDEAKSAQDNMDKDRKLLQAISVIGHPILRFYDWEGPSATYGYFINPWEHLDFHGVEKMGLQLGRRPTGGGVVFHLTDMAFSVLVPASHPAYSLNTLENYAFVNSHVARAVASFKKEILPTLLHTEEKSVHDKKCHFCMAKPTIYDVMSDGKKIGGAAQRRTREGFLHQGTLSIAMPEETVLKALLKSSQIIQAMKEHSYFLANVHQLHETRSELRRLLEIAFVKER